jgi:uncharacterized protein
MTITEGTAGRLLRAAPADTRIPFQDDFLFGDLAHPGGLRLAGSRCPDCGIALWGVRRRCENCASDRVAAAVFEPAGSVFTFTVQRYAPPQPHALPQPWVPRPVAWVDLEGDGPRVLAPVACAPSAMAIGMRVRLACQVGFVDAQGREVVTYGFVPAEASA